MGKRSSGFVAAAFLTAGVLCLALAGCGEKQTSEEADTVKNAGKISTPAPAAPGAPAKKPMVAPPPI